MSTDAQVAANQANAQHSTGPKTPEGKAASSQNNLRHGFAGEFSFLPDENVRAFEVLLHRLVVEHKPLTCTEELLVEKMAQHHWLSQRAVQLQNAYLQTSGKPADTHRALSLYLRYQTANDRGFHKCLNDLLKLRAETRKEEIGFESQERLKQEHTRKQSVENRRQEAHKFAIWLAEGKAEHQQLLNARLETPEMRVPNRMERMLARQQAA